MSGANKETMKIRAIVVYRMLENRKNFITVSEILRNLQNHYSITADRKTIYSDVAAIDRFLPIESRQGKKRRLSTVGRFRGRRWLKTDAEIGILSITTRQKPH